MGARAVVSMGFLMPLAVAVVIGSMASPNPLYLPIVGSAALQLGPAPWLYQLLLSQADQWTACLLVCTALPIVVYWANGLLFLLIDVFHRPAIFRQFKLQPDKGFDMQLLRKVITNLLVGQLGVIVPMAFFYTHATEQGWGFRVDSTLPSAAEMLHHFLWFIIGNELIFYYGHRALHTKSLYQNIHKIHHEFKAPIALVASYCHPVEMLLSNVLPLTFTAFLMRAHLYTFAVWIVFGVLGTQFHHCGYKWPWVSQVDEMPNFHDFHHEHFNSNFGSMGWLDAFHGTADKFDKQHRAGQTLPVWALQMAGIVGLAMMPVTMLESSP